MRLIDGDELIVKLYQDQPMDWTGSDAEVQELNDWELFRNMVNNAPTVDAEIVVRCKECKWFANNNDGEWFGCWLFNAIRAVPEDAPTPDDFCSYGERKNEENG